MKKLRVAIIGQGRSGRDIHGNYFLQPENNIIEVVAVVDAIEDRRERAKKDFGCEGCPSAATCGKTSCSAKEEKA